MRSVFMSVVVGLMCWMLVSLPARAETAEIASTPGAKVEEILAGEYDHVAKEAEGMVPAEPPALEQSAPAVKAETPAKTSAEAAETTETEEAAAPVEVDPCEAYKVSYESYVVCQDRIKKVERMMQERDKRRARYMPAKKEEAVKEAPAKSLSRKEKKAAKRKETQEAKIEKEREKLKAREDSLKSK